MYKISKNLSLSLVIISLSLFVFFIAPSLIKADSYTPISFDCVKHGSGSGPDCNGLSASTTGGLRASRVDWSVAADGFGNLGSAGGNVSLNVCLTPNRVMWTGACVNAIKTSNTSIIHGPCGGSGINQDGKIGDLDGCKFTGKLESSDPALKYMNADVYVNDAHMWGTIAVYGNSLVVPGVCSPAEGSSCTSSANSCGQTNTGTIQASCSCNAVTPPESSCPSPGRYKCLGTNQCGWDPNDSGPAQCSTNADCTSASPINGSCSATHYNCSYPPGVNRGVNQRSNSNEWTWTCEGSNDGTNASCSEIKSTSSQLTPTITAPSCSNTNYNVQISWPAVNNNISVFIDDNGSASSFSKSPVDGNSGSTSAPSGFTQRIPGAPTTLVFQPGVRHYSFIQNDSVGGPTVSWIVNQCGSVSGPDLTASNPTQTTAIVGVPVNFLSVITNIGNAPTH